jgi:toxin HigB-1
MIVSFKSSREQQIWNGKLPKGFPSQILRRSQLKFAMINNAKTLEDLRQPPSNHLELLKGDLKGYHSIRINDQWRVVFKWLEGAVHDVQIVDYH